MSLLLCSLLLAQAPTPDAAAPAPAPAPPAPAAAPATEPAPVDDENAVERALGRLPPLLWDKSQSLDARVGKVTSAALVVLGLVSLSAALAGVGLTAVLQLSPWPETPDARTRPRSTYIQAAVATTAFATVLGVVGVLGGLFALFVA